MARVLAQLLLLLCEPILWGNWSRAPGSRAACTAVESCG